MPKLKQSEEQIKCSYVSGIIKKYMGISRITVKQLAKRIGISSSGMYLKLREPDGFNYGELLVIFKILKVPAEEILQCFIITGGEGQV